VQREYAHVIYFVICDYLLFESEIIVSVKERQVCGRNISLGESVGDAEAGVRSERGEVWCAMLHVSENIDFFLPLTFAPLWSMCEVP
jgi:hypothetical protein